METYKVGEILLCISEGKVSQYFTLGKQYKILSEDGLDTFRVQTNTGSITIHKVNISKLFKKIRS